MKTFLFVFILLTVMVGDSFAAALTLEEQQRIIDNYVAVTQGRSADGQSLPAALAAGDHDLGGHKCGTSALLEFHRNYSSLDPRLVQAAGAMLFSRPTNEYYYDTPGGRIRLHYDKSNANQAQVWQAGVDSDGDGVPNYVESLAGYADRAYAYMTDTLGYPHPLNDSGTTNGGDARVDIYLVKMGYYGATFSEYQDSLVTPSWIEIDHDFQDIYPYVGRPLAAAAVTIAHELFHTVHFSMDATEGIEWFEMTAVWMEEEQWDDVNDYYYYLPLFFNDPTRSIQSSSQTHHYASAIFPIYLSETYGDDIIRSVWEYAATDQGRTSYLEALDMAVDSASGGEAGYHSAFAEFAVWNFFTGPYARQAPNGIGYPEAEYFDFFRLDSMDVHRSYPVTVLANVNTHSPEPNAATYLRLENLQAISQDALLDWFVYGDTIPGEWGISAIYQLEQHPDSHLVVSTTRPLVVGDFIQNLVGVDGEIEVSDYRSVTVVFTPTVTDTAFIHTRPTVGVGYVLREPSATDSTLINLPAAVLAPYPNPAVAARMDGAPLKFRFRVPTDATTYPEYPSAYLVVDVFTIVGEQVTTVEGRFIEDDRTGEHREGIYEAEWNMKNAGGQDVASGAYLAYARLFTTVNRDVLLAEDRVKVALIR